ncbi:hypothetical protein CPB84DRAFT_1634457, partial [Gymnopilus junonius]
MAQLARDYHAELQNNQVNVPPELRNDITQKILQSIQKKTTPEQKEILKSKVTEEEIESALKSGKNAKAAGIDGITYELWKSVHEEYKRKKEDDTQSFNIVSVMTKVFNDIEENGMCSSTKFSE